LVAIRKKAKRKQMRNGELSPFLKSVKNSEASFRAFINQRNPVTMEQMMNIELKINRVILKISFLSK
jgi:hypothetical protein